MKKTLLSLIALVICIPVITFAANGVPFQQLQDQVNQIVNQVNTLTSRVEKIEEKPEVESRIVAGSAWSNHLGNEWSYVRLTGTGFDVTVKDPLSSFPGCWDTLGGNFKIQCYARVTFWTAFTDTPTCVVSMWNYDKLPYALYNENMYCYTFDTTPTEVKIRCYGYEQDSGNGQIYGGVFFPFTLICTQ